MKRVCSTWVLHFLQMNKIQARFYDCTENLIIITNKSEFLTQVITTDEGWIHHYDSLMENESPISWHSSPSHHRRLVVTSLNSGNFRFGLLWCPSIHLIILLIKFLFYGKKFSHSWRKFFEYIFNINAQQLFRSFQS